MHVWGETSENCSQQGFFTWFCCVSFITIKFRMFRVGKWSVCFVPQFVTDLWGRARHLLLINLSFCILKSRLLLLKTKHTKEWIVMEDSTWIVHWVFLGKVSGKPSWMVSGCVCCVRWCALWELHINHWPWKSVLAFCFCKNCVSIPPEHNGNQENVTSASVRDTPKQPEGCWLLLASPYLLKVTAHFLPLQ